MFGLASVLATGCIVPDAPEYGAPRPTPVFIDQSSISPNPQNVLHIDNVNGNSADFSFLVRSEDAGEGLVTAFYIDYKHSTQQQYVDHHRIPAATFDVERAASFHFNLQYGLFPLDASCHVLTMTVLHESGWDYSTNQQIGNPPDLSEVSWLTDFNDDDGAVPLASCPDVASNTGH